MSDLTDMITDPVILYGLRAMGYSGLKSMDDLVSADGRVKVRVLTESEDHADRIHARFERANEGSWVTLSHILTPSSYEDFLEELVSMLDAHGVPGRESGDTVPPADMLMSWYLTVLGARYNLESPASTGNDLLTCSAFATWHVGDPAKGDYILFEVSEDTTQLRVIGHQGVQGVISLAGDAMPEGSDRLAIADLVASVLRKHNLSLDIEVDNNGV